MFHQDFVLFPSSPSENIPPLVSHSYSHQKNEPLSAFGDYNDFGFAEDSLISPDTIDHDAKDSGQEPLWFPPLNTDHLFTPFSKEESNALKFHSPHRVYPWHTQVQNIPMPQNESVSIHLILKNAFTDHHHQRTNTCDTDDTSSSIDDAALFSDTEHEEEFSS